MLCCINHSSAPVSLEQISGLNVFWTFISLGFKCLVVPGVRSVSSCSLAEQALPVHACSFSERRSLSAGLRSLPFSSSGFSSAPSHPLHQGVHLGSHALHLFYILKFACLPDLVFLNGFFLRSELTILLILELYGCHCSVN